ncbi:MULTISPECIES: MFS transporter [Phyllobacteriaceae]|jgi:MFS transporter, DHA2 family, multidrug resistance protein|uniref:Permease n=1 Tax=Mesorhizobium hungaricum TaxID=1566387 RepID=A0A1C2DDB1_9HYPH|nr:MULTISPECIES: MFS transporter [Mesorhizobium]MBN9235047.1 MFS transporter [Mesorhizobium sp.]MDQ0330829.1 DHA2 family multidrug resistance protein-like MFS transporter [Mesorhizobium sp. YL-MeA3-2017]OCX12748.1 permease [Mesorhizobium hungaricum]
MTDAAIADVPDRSAWLGLMAVLPLVLIVAMDGSILYLAMPRVTSALLPSADQALWILDIYGFIVGSLLITFGNIGDRYGRLKLIMVGATVFGAGSLGAAYAQSAESLIAFRALMGLGGATLLPSGLAIVSALFPDARQRARAIGIFAATFAAGFAVGPILGGMLLRHFEWSAVFLINVPVVLAFLIAAPMLLREVRATSYGRIDGLSLLFSFAGILLFTYAVKAAATHGLGAVPVAAGIVGIVALALFLRRQVRIDYPLLDLSLFSDRIFSIAILTGLLSLVVWSAAAYLSGIYLQSVLGFDVFTAALLTLPGAIVLTATCVGTAGIVERIGRKPALVATHVLIGAGVLLLMFTTVEAGVAVFIASTVIAGIGYGLSFSLVAEIAVSAVPAERAGAAGSIAETSNELGNALGISLLGSLAALSFRLLGPDVAGTLDETLTQPELAADTVLHAKTAFLTGLHVVVGVGGLLMLILGIVTWLWLPKKLPQ